MTDNIHIINIEKFKKNIQKLRNPLKPAFVAKNKKGKMFYNYEHKQTQMSAAVDDRVDVGFREVARPNPVGISAYGWLETVERIAV